MHIPNVLPQEDKLQTAKNLQQRNLPQSAHKWSTLSLCCHQTAIPCAWLVHRQQTSGQTLAQSSRHWFHYLATDFWHLLPEACTWSSWINCETVSLHEPAEIQNFHKEQENVSVIWLYKSKTVLQMPSDSLLNLTCRNTLSLSSGAVQVLDTMPATPPATKWRHHFPESHSSSEKSSGTERSSPTSRFWKYQGGLNYQLCCLHTTITI